ncbi:UNVERIFIED_CONTAM: Adhesion G protein-coupled receptor B2 [Gekko kuhli]
MCQGTGVQGYPCEGSGEEVKTCNEKKCPAYHEMCKDEYVTLMTWKKAVAGEIVYNKCPANATGSASRRCLLNSHGVAYWGAPSFARCVSHEYRYLHLSLREHLAKGQRMLAGEGMSQVVRGLLELVAHKTYYSGDLLFSVEILRNVTDTYKRATYIPSADDVQTIIDPGLLPVTLVTSTPDIPHHSHWMRLYLILLMLLSLWSWDRLTAITVIKPPTAPPTSMVLVPPPDLSSQSVVHALASEPTIPPGEHPASPGPSSIPSDTKS